MTIDNRLNEPAAVVGFGKTGKGVLDFLLSASPGGAKKPAVFLYNDTPIENAAEQEHYEKKGVKFLVGDDQFKRLSKAKRIILSPGVDGGTPRFEALRQTGREIISEIELAFSIVDSRGVPVIAVTGTNGKSTTVSLIHHILSRCGFNSFLVGNIGKPFISEVDQITDQPGTVVVVEVSSFQLEEILHFRPHIGVILNITPDHLDRYASMEDYISAKLNMVKNQEGGDYLVLNRDDELSWNKYREERGRFGSARTMWFSGDCGSPGVNTCVSGEDLYWKPGSTLETASASETTEIISLRDNPLRGLHNLENIMAAVTAACLMGAAPGDIASAIASFKGLTHRMESLGKTGSVEFINDSKATNVDAALKSISSIREPMVVILGGKNKGGDFALLAPIVNERVDKVLLVGQAADSIRQQLEAAGGGSLNDKLEPAADFDQAVARGWQLLEKKGGVVLLAPACASFDMFNNFEHRGEVFREAVLKFKQAKKNG
jgi:UDP-N-acetylmuramoylalanine--D-glutamate ligase